MRLGVDLGGTKIEVVALGDGGKELLRRARADAAERLRGHRPRHPRSRAGGGSKARADTARVGIAIPGAISPDTGLVKNANSTSLIGHPLDKDLGAALGRPVRVANDANCFALSEATDGAAAGARRRLRNHRGHGRRRRRLRRRARARWRPRHRGRMGTQSPAPRRRGAEFRDPPLCYCGKRGCIESWCSGPALRGRIRARDRPHAARGRISRRPQRMATRRASPRWSALPTASRAPLRRVVNLIDPDAIVIGGGLSNIDRLYRELPQRVERYAFTPEGPTRILKNMHGDFERRARRGVAVAATRRDRRLPSNERFLPRLPCRRADECAALRVLQRPAHSLPCRTRHAFASRISIATRSMRRSRSATIPSLRDKPVIVGGGERGVVSTACYIARISRRAFGHADVPGAASYVPHADRHQTTTWRNMPKPRARCARMMRELTPLVEPLSLDEAYLDLVGHGRLHGVSPAKTMARLAQAHRKRNRHHGLHRPQPQQIPRQACLRTRQAARLRRDRPRRSHVFPARQAGRLIRGAGKALQERACERRHHPHRATAGRRSARSRRTLRHRRVCGCIAWRMRKTIAAVDPDGEMQKHFVRDHVHRRTFRGSKSSKRILWAAGRTRFGARQVAADSADAP